MQNMTARQMELYARAALRRQSRDAAAIATLLLTGTAR